MKYAKITEGVVTAIVEGVLDGLDDDVVPATDDAQIGGTWDGKAFKPKPKPRKAKAKTPEDVRQSALDAIKKAANLTDEQMDALFGRKQT